MLTKFTVAIICNTYIHHIIMVYTLNLYNVASQISRKLEKINKFKKIKFSKGKDLLHNKSAGYHTNGLFCVLWRHIFTLREVIILPNSPLEKKLNNVELYWNSQPQSILNFPNIQNHRKKVGSNPVNPVIPRLAQ